MREKSRQDAQPGFVLHSYPYRETSLLVEAFTRDHGRVALMARGARRPKSALRGILLSFQPLLVSWSGRSELRTLTRAEWRGPYSPLGGQALICGFYLNELLLKLLAREDPHEELYDAYAASLARLAAGEPQAAVLRGFERRLLNELGYALRLERDAERGAPIDPARRYLYEPERGPVACNGGAPGGMQVSGQTLLDIARDDYGRAQTRDEARALMRALIAQRLSGQTLHTRNVLMELQDL